MRRALLLQSVARRLGADVEVVEAAYVWSRHRRMIPFAVVAFVGIASVAGWAGAEDWPTRIVLGAAGVAVAITATTDYKVLAETSDSLVLLQASRIRQVATALIRELPANAVVRQVGGTIIAADWEIDGAVYTVPRSSEQAITHMATASQ